MSNCYAQLLTVAAMIIVVRDIPVTHADNTVGERWDKEVVYTATENVMTAVAADFTGDGKADVITNAAGKTVLLVAPDWKPVLIDTLKDGRFIHSEVMDVDRDGDPDYIGARYKPGLIVWYECPDDPVNDRWIRRTIDARVNGIHGVLVGDVDGDSSPDLLATSAQPTGDFPNSLAWFKPPSSPKSVDHWTPNIFASGDAPGLTHYLGLGDINGDGRADAATGSKGGPQDTTGKGEWFAWWEAPADPRTPWKKHSLPGPHPGATNIHPADVDGDGKTDLVASRGHGVGVIWFRNPDWKIHTIDPRMKEPHCLTVADLDGDGDIDAATCGFGSEEVAWYENDGLGNFRIHSLDHKQGAYDIRSVDMDSDGDLDLLVAGRHSKNVVWYRNPHRQAEQSVPVP